MSSTTGVLCAATTRWLRVWIGLIMGFRSSAAPRSAIGGGGTTPFELATLTDALARAGDLAGFSMRRRFHEIGSIEGLRATELYIRSSRT